MASQRFPVKTIESMMPSEDARSSEKTFVIRGRNFVFDSKGPKSGFGTLMLSPYPLGLPRDVHGVRVQGYSFVFTQDSILVWRNEVPYMWEILYTFETQVPVDYRFPWQVVFLNGKIILTHALRGTFVAEIEIGTEHLWLHPQTPDTIPGLLTEIKGMIVVRGRVVLVNDYQIQWSNTGDFTDLTPAEEGAGFQTIAAIVDGTFVSITSFQDGFIVFTTKGAILAQYTGDEVTWRFDPHISLERPISAWATKTLSTGATAFMSRRGMFTSGGGGNPEAWTPQFNEYLREYLQHKDMNRWFFRLEYDENTQTIYLLESQNLVEFSRALVLKPTLDKWSEFSNPTYGMLPVTHDKFGWVDVNGFVHYFADQFSRETDPHNAVGLDRHYPRLQKTLTLASSSAVSRAVQFDLASPSVSPEIPRAAWYSKGSFIPAAPALGGMDSWIEIGYLRPEALSMSADAYTEFQEVAVGGIAVAAPTPMDFTTSWKAKYFYIPHEDWNSESEIISADFQEDLLVEDGEEDRLLGPPFGYEDYRYLDFPIVLFPTQPHEDWDDDGEAEDWNSPVSGLPKLTYNLLIRSSEDGITFEEYEPTMAKFNSATQEYSTITSGVYHTIRVEAIDVNQWYHITALDLTMYYGGQG